MPEEEIEEPAAAEKEEAKTEAPEDVKTTDDSNVIDDSADKEVQNYLISYCQHFTSYVTK